MSGCSDGGASAAPTLPPVTPTTAAPPSPTGTATPGPTRPPEADAPTSLGAEAFARYYIDVLNEAARTFDPGPLEAISDPGCLTCRNYAQSFRESAEGKERYDGGRLTVKTTSAVAVDENHQQVLLNYDAEALTVYNSSGAATVTNPAETNSTLAITLRRSGGTWVVVEAARA